MKQRSMYSRVATAFAACVILAAPRQSDAALLVTSSGTDGVISHATVFSANTVGWRFVVGSRPLQVSSLGFYDFNSDGLGSAIMVGVWNTSTAQQVAAVTVPGGTTGSLVNDFRYTNLGAAVTLDANTDYTIGYRSANGGLMEDGRFRVGQTFSSSVSLVSGGFGLRHSFNTEPLSTDFATQMPGSNLGDTVPLLGPNMQFVEIPEPGSISALACVGLLARRSRQQNRGMRSRS